jgi:hypothetical protein
MSTNPLSRWALAVVLVAALQWSIVPSATAQFGGGYWARHWWLWPDYGWLWARVGHLRSQSQFAGGPWLWNG